jgi:hypothetical protein
MAVELAQFKARFGAAFEDGLDFGVLGDGFLERENLLCLRETRLGTGRGGTGRVRDQGRPGCGAGAEEHCG